MFRGFPAGRVYSGLALIFIYYLVQRIDMYYSILEGRREHGYT